MKLKVLSSSCLLATLLMAGATAYAEEIKDVTFSYPINVAEASTPATEQPKEEVKKEEEKQEQTTTNNTAKEETTEKKATEQSQSVATPVTTTAPVVNSNTLPKTSGTSGAIDNFGNTQEGGKVVNDANVNTSDDKSDKLVEFQPIDNSKKYYLKIGTDGKVLLLTQVKEGDLANLIKGDKSNTTSTENKTPVTITTAPTTKTTETKSGVGQYLVYGVLAVLFVAGIYFFKKLKAKRTKDDEEDFLEDNYDEIEDEENENRER